jgi:uncharacterized protein (TIGR00369 family)
MGMKPETTKRVPSGLDFFRDMMTGKAPRTAMGELLNLQLLEVDPGRVVFGTTATPAVYNTVGIAHGGFTATLLDSALGCAINTLATPPKVFTTVELKINYIRPIAAETGPLRCEAHVLHVGSRVGMAEGRIVDAQGKLYAHGSTTCVAVET